MRAASCHLADCPVDPPKYRTHEAVTGYVDLGVTKKVSTAKLRTNLVLMDGPHASSRPFQQIRRLMPAPPSASHGNCMRRTATLCHLHAHSNLGAVKGIYDGSNSNWSEN
jgi:hypothetical protein